MSRWKYIQWTSNLNATDHKKTDKSELQTAFHSFFPASPSRALSSRRIHHWATL
jgi:hypothetical protein